MNFPKITPDWEAMNYIVEATCFCGKVTTARVNGFDLFKYNNGALVQDAFPDLTPAERDALFISGLCETCWNDLMLDEDYHECYYTETPDGFGCPRCIYG